MLSVIIGGHAVIRSAFVSRVGLPERLEVVRLAVALNVFVVFSVSAVTSCDALCPGSISSLSSIRRRFGLPLRESDA